MLIEFDTKLFLQVQPKTLKEFYDKVLKKPLATIAERGAVFETYGLGDAEEYIGLARQNQSILEMLYLVAENETPAE